MPGEPLDFDRRSILTGIGAAALAGVGVGAASGEAAAKETKRRLADVYADERMLAAAFREHGAALRETLVAEGVVDPSFGFDDLDFEIDADVNGIDPDAEDRLAGVQALEEDGTITALGMVSTSTDSHELSLYVQPERDEAYAFVQPKGGGDTFMASGDGVTPQGCMYTTCGDYCSRCYDERITYSCDPSCQNCSVYKKDCGCCICKEQYC